MLLLSFLSLIADLLGWSTLSLERFSTKNEFSQVFHMGCNYTVFVGNMFLLRSHCRIRIWNTVKKNSENIWPLTLVRWFLAISCAELRRHSGRVGKGIGAYEPKPMGSNSFTGSSPVCAELFIFPLLSRSLSLRGCFLAFRLMVAKLKHHRISSMVSTSTYLCAPFWSSIHTVSFCRNCGAMWCVEIWRLRCVEMLVFTKYVQTFRLMFLFLGQLICFQRRLLGLTAIRSKFISSYGKAKAGHL